ncbi:MAG: formyltransferase family protein [Polaromonas sp.]|nr:formyltransferase family protein [Polaromonas sp.]
MKVVIFADGYVGAKITRFIVDQYADDLALVITTQKNAITDLALEAGIATSVYETEEIALATMSDIAAPVDLGILAWWPKIIRKRLLSFPKSGFINTHPSLLPRQRGKHYNFWAIVEQSPFGVTLHRVDEGIDSGEIVSQQEVTYDWSDNGASLYQKAQEAMIALFRETYPQLRQRGVASVPQDESLVSFHHSSELEAASTIELDQSYSGRELLNLLRARTFPGHPGCRFRDNGEVFEVSIDIKKVK